ncbi:hypothetical protein DLAC_11466 [Tieghemostelium lacteum]|uniref:Uncharacterized protein n=1 Tax=Tieghemostelium lacteum TaxID=361077 RepID=A0A152A825_TIELA|nr:hypothetical protein DLAC_11466 [Tieghemostelium lacteum]|eukprot:KYR02358.1 hypothetical protein DLAC_11466 [Tieghemostelium lacteum]
MNYTYCTKIFQDQFKIPNFEECPICKTKSLDTNEKFITPNHIFSCSYALLSYLDIDHESIISLTKSIITPMKKRQINDYIEQNERRTRRKVIVSNDIDIEDQFDTNHNIRTPQHNNNMSISNGANGHHHVGNILNFMNNNNNNNSTPVGGSGTSTTPVLYNNTTNSNNQQNSTTTSNDGDSEDEDLLNNNRNEPLLLTHPSTNNNTNNNIIQYNQHSTSLSNSLNNNTHLPLKISESFISKYDKTLRCMGCEKQITGQNKDNLFLMLNGREISFCEPGKHFYQKDLSILTTLSDIIDYLVIDNIDRDGYYTEKKCCRPKCINNCGMSMFVYNKKLNNTYRTCSKKCLSEFLSTLSTSHWNRLNPGAKVNTDCDLRLENDPSLVNIPTLVTPIASISPQNTPSSVQRDINRDKFINLI